MENIISTRIQNSDTRVVHNILFSRQAYFVLCRVAKTRTVLLLSINRRLTVAGIIELMIFAKLAITTDNAKRTLRSVTSFAKQTPCKDICLLPSVPPPRYHHHRLQSIPAVIIATTKNHDQNGKVFRRRDGNTDP